MSGDGKKVPTALYRLLGDDDARVYIGIAKSFGRRWQQHAHSQPWWPEVRRQTIDWYPDRDSAEAAEKAAIKAEHPKYNFMHNQGTPEWQPTRRSQPTHEGDCLLGAQMRRLRTERGISQQAVAGLMRAGGRPWHQATVARVERGERQLGFTEGIDLAGHLGASPEEFCKFVEMAYGDTRSTERSAA